MKTILEQIYDFADHAHGEQRRKYTSERYMVHPLRVMELCKPVTDEQTILAAALLHDVLEDTPIKEADLLLFLQQIQTKQAADQTLKLVIELTDVYIASHYPDLNRRERKAREAKRMQYISPEAQTIKYADILDNCLEIVKYDREFAPRFLKECRQLLQVMDTGHTSLRTAALEVVEKSLKTIG